MLEVEWSKDRRVSTVANLTSKGESSSFEVVLKFDDREETTRSAKRIASGYAYEIEPARVGSTVDRDYVDMQ